MIDIEIILASRSQRRLDLLTAAGISCRTVAADIEETVLPDEQPEALVCRLARLKAVAVAPQFPSDIVLGSDTIVYQEPDVLGKPADYAQASEFLARLSGKTHQVYTGVCLYRENPHLLDIWYACTDVTFRSLTADDVESYLACTQPLDKAGGYGIQDHGDLIIEKIRGLRSNVVGLPIEEVTERLAGHIDTDA
ncbi:MAG: Maf family protein [Lentisphaeria bacterium]